MTKKGTDEEGKIRVGTATFNVTRNLEVFLVEELKNFVAATRDGSDKWNPRRLSMRISLCEAIDTTLDDETIRRHLRPTPPQNVSPQTLGIIANFLAFERWITPQAIAAHAGEINFRAALEMQRFFAVPDSDAQIKFQKHLEGAYIGYELHDEKLYETTLTMAVVDAASIVGATDGIASYHLSNPEGFIRGSNSLDPALQGRFPELLKECGGRPVDHLKAGGFALASADLMAFLLRDEVTARAAVYTVLDVGYDEEDKVEFLIGLRNTGWAAAERPPMPGEPVSDPSPLIRRGVPVNFRIFRPTYGKSKYSGNKEEIMVKRSTIKRRRYFMASKESVDLLIERNVKERNAVRAFYAAIKDPTERLIQAIDGSDIEYALRAVDDGADLNAMHPAGFPLIHIVAGRGNRELAEKMIGTGRCDLTIRDRRDLLPSHCARMYAGDHELADMLIAEQAKQFEQSGKDPRSPTVPDYGKFNPSI